METPAGDTAEVKAGYWLAAGGGALLALACFLPWVTATAPFVGTISRNGLDGGGDGVGLLVAGIVVVAFAIWGVVTGRQSALSVGWIYMIVGLITVVAGYFEKNNVSDRIGQATSSSSLIVATTGAGIWLIFVAGGLVVAGGFMLVREAKPLMPSSPPTRTDPVAAIPSPPRLDAGAPDPNAPTSKRKMALIALIGVGILGGLLWVYLGSSARSGSGGTSGSHAVRYIVIGHNGESITYQTGSQDSAQVTNAGMAWSDTESMGDGDYYSVSAQNQGSGSIACSVSVDGIGVASNTSSGESATCTASGNV